MLATSPLSTAVLWPSIEAYLTSAERGTRALTAAHLARCMLCGACCMLSVVCCMLCVACCVLRVACCTFAGSNPTQYPSRKAALDGRVHFELTAAMHAKRVLLLPACKGGSQSEYR